MITGDFRRSEDYALQSRFLFGIVQFKPGTITRLAILATLKAHQAIFSTKVDNLSARLQKSTLKLKKTASAPNVSETGVR